jgi:rhamnosyltransferase
VKQRDLDAPAATPGARRPRVLVLLAACNGARWIGQQIDSVLAQENVDLRLIIRDDGSTDGTPRELDRFAGDPRVSTLDDATPTGSAAGNFLALIRENPAEGFDFVAFADQDDLWDRDKLCRACHRLAAERSAGYSSATLAVWESGRQRVVRPSGAPTGGDFLFEGAGQGCTFVLTATLYERVREFITPHPDLTRQLHYHDWAVYALARSWGLRWSFDPQPSMRYRQHVGNDTGARGTLAGVAKRLALIREGWYRAQLRAIAELCSAAAPANTKVAEWRSKLMQPDGWHRRWQTARFCLRGGRRRGRDNAIVVMAALAGWI